MKCLCHIRPPPVEGSRDAEHHEEETPEVSKKKAAGNTEESVSDASARTSSCTLILPEANLPDPSAPHGVQTRVFSAAFLPK